MIEVIKDKEIANGTTLTGYLTVRENHAVMNARMGFRIHITNTKTIRGWHFHTEQMITNYLLNRQ